MTKHYLPIGILLLVQILFFSFELSAKEYTVENFTTLNGLSQNDVHSLYQDSEGFIWAATNDGLNRFDSYSFKYYGLNNSGLASNLILDIAEDNSNNLWIATADKGAFIYQRDYDTFKRVDFESMGLRSNNFTCKRIFVDASGKVWIFNSQNKELYIITKAEKKSTLPYELVTQKKFSNIFALCNSKNETFCVTNKGLYSFNNRYFTLEDSTICNATALVTRDSTLLVAMNNSIVQHDLVNHSNLTLYTAKSFIRNFVSKGSQFFFTTQKGVFQIDDIDKQKELQAHKIYTFDNNLSQDMIFDFNGSIWIGCLKNGIYYLHENLKPIKTFRSFGNNHISALSDEVPNRILVGTEGSGLYVLSKELSKVSKEHYFTDKIVQSVSYSTFLQSILIGVQGEGIYTIDNHHNIKLLIDDVYDPRDILEDGKYLWIATYYKGLYRYDMKTAEMLKIEVENTQDRIITRNILRDHLSNLWFATDHGLFFLDKEVKIALKPTLSQRIPHTKTDYIIPLLEDDNNNIWYGTIGKGLKKVSFDELGNVTRIDSFSTRNGLTSNTVKSLIKDGEGNIWMGTNKGINRLNLENNQFRLLDMSDGLQDYEFNELSVCQLSKNHFLFGGVNGMNEFYSNELKTDSAKSMPTFTDFKLFNVSISEDSIYSNYFKKNICAAQNFDLPYQWNTFTIEFSALNYSDPSKIRYQYMLDGVDNKWIEVGAKRREASYTKLAHGNYTFKLRATNADGIWNSSTRQIGLIIRPPFWLTGYAYFLYFILIVITVYWIRLYYLHRLHERNSIYLAEFEKKKSEEMLEMKTNFFTNISHELRTPLTLVLSPLHIMIDKNKMDKDSKRLLGVMNHNGNLLLKLVNELLSFSKIEKDDLKLNCVNENFSFFAKQIYDQFKFWASEKGINFDYSVNNNEIYLSYDPYLMEQVMYNLISNAIKHTPKGGFVSFSVVNKEDHLLISVSDSGKGISDASKDHIFERFYTESSNLNSGGTGIGLYLTKKLIELHQGKISFASEEGKGSVFIIELPKQTSSKPLQLKDADTEESLLSMPIKESNAATEVEDEEHKATDLPHLLIVDDNEEICLILTSLFRGQYKVSVAYDGESAWEKLPELQPNLVISDIMMPKMNGLELCEKIKQDERTSHIPVILLTAKSSEEDCLVGYKFQADSYCTKPFNNKILKEMVNSILVNRSRMIKKNHHSLEVEPSDVTTTSVDERLMHKLISIVEENIGNSEFQVEDLCHGIGFTPIMLNKKLKALIGLTANVFIRQIRLKRAANLLKTGRYSVSEVTYEVGFNDLRYFRNCFKKEFGILPLDYRKKYQNQQDN